MSTDQPSKNPTPVNPARTKIHTTVAAKPLPSLPPEKTLAPLRELWSNHRDSPTFYQKLADYTLDMLGAMAVSIYETNTDSSAINMIAFASPYGRSSLKKFTTDSSKLKQSLETLGSQRSSRVIDNRQCGELIAPFALQNGKRVCFIAVLPPEKVLYTEPCFVILHLVTQFLIQRELLLDADENAGAFVQATMLVEMFTRTAEARDLPRALFSLSNELQKFFQCSRVAIGSGGKRNCKILALSGQSSEDRKGIGISQMNEAIREAISLNQVLVWPNNTANLPGEVVVSANRDDLLHSYQAGSILVAPLNDHRNDPQGAICLLWPQQRMPSKNDYQLVKACQPHLSSLLGFLKKSKPGPIGGTLGKWFSGPLLKRIAILLVCALAIAALFLPITYRLPADCRIQPVVRSIVAAPFDATLYRSYAKPGDIVVDDQILAELDGRELRVQLAEAIAAQKSALKKRDSAMVLEQASDLQMAQLEVERLKYEVKRLQFRNDNLIIRAPNEGVVLAGNLKRSEGVPVTTGQMLYEIAPMEEMLIEIAIPEGEVRYLKEGAEVKMRLESESSRVWQTEIVRLHPASVIEEGENVFIAEARLSNEDQSLRPGMKGSVRVVTEKRSLGWILFHRLWDYLRLKVW